MTGKITLYVHSEGFFFIIVIQEESLGDIDSCHTAQK